MSVTGRARSVARLGVKVQRRIVIAQALWWPTLMVTGVAIGTAVVFVVKRRGAGPAWPEPVAVSVRPHDTPVDA